MRKLRYNELDELAWEYEHGCVEHPDDEPGDVCWDQYDPETVEWFEREITHENAPHDEDDEDDETGAGIFGNQLNHAQNAQKGYCTCVSNGTVYGHGEKDEIERVVFNLLEPFKDYHFEFKFFEAK